MCGTSSDRASGHTKGRSRTDNLVQPSCCWPLSVGFDAITRASVDVVVRTQWRNLFKALRTDTMADYLPE